jgi:RNA polymerase sigma-70 factor, ECF subfamily
MGTQPEPGGISGAAFARLLEATQVSLSRYLRSLLGNEEDARDVLQDVYVEAWRIAERGMPPFNTPMDEIPISRWLFHVGYCHAVSALRHRSVLHWEPMDGVLEHALSGQAQGSSLEDQVAEREQLRDALGELDPQDAASLLMHELHGYTSTEIAQSLGVSPDAVRKRLSRAMQTLRHAYHRQEAHPPRKRGS